MLELFNTITENKENIAVIGAALVTIASALANIFPKASRLGKLANFLALNFTVDK